MKRTLTLIITLLISLCLTLVLSGCKEKKEGSNNGLSSDGGTSHQLGDVVIPPGAEREREGGWSSSNGSSSGDGFSVSIEGDDHDIIITGEQTFEVDLSTGGHSIIISNDDEEDDD